MPVGHPSRGILVGGSGTNLVRLTADEDADEADEDWLIDKIRIGKAIRLVMRHPSAELVDTYGLRERRIVQMAAGASLIEATLDCYDLQEIEASDASLREGAILAWDRAGDAWRERLSELISGERPAGG
jgi:exopolyphosphatase/pppGpp-phosphohydrolase